MAGRPTIIIHSLADARIGLAAAHEARRPVRLLSGPGAAAALGPPVFHAITQDARAEWPGVDAEFVLDCGGDPGLALAALRHGIQHVRVTVADDTRASLADIAQALGARLVTAAGPALDLADVSDPAEHCRLWLATAEPG
jgi:hypothetical protein